MKDRIHDREFGPQTTRRHAQLVHALGVLGFSRDRIEAKKVSNFDAHNLANKVVGTQHWNTLVRRCLVSHNRHLTHVRPWGLWRGETPRQTLSGFFGYSNSRYVDYPTVSFSTLREVREQTSVFTHRHRIEVRNKAN